MSANQSAVHYRSCNRMPLLLACCRSWLNGSLLHSHRQRPVSDRLAKAIFLLLGVGVLTPWNAFISAVPYFQSRICSLPGAEEQFEAWVGLIFNLCSVGALSLLLLWPWITQKLLCNNNNDHDHSHTSFIYLCWRRRRRTTTRIPDTDESVRSTIHGTTGTANPTSSHQLQQPQQASHSNNNNNQDHFYWLVVLPLALCLAVFMVTDVLVAVQTIQPSAFLATTLWGMALSGASVAFAQAGSVAASGVFPAHIGINPFVSGQAVGGVVVSALNFLSSYAEDPQPYWNQHCDSNNKTAAVIQRAATWQQQDNTTTSSASTIYHQESVSIITDPTSSCPPYDKFDTAVFFYFLVGAIVLFGCIIGYILLDQSTQHHRHGDPYEAVEMERTREEEFRDEPLTGSPDLLLEVESTSHQHQHPFGIAQESFDNTDDAPSDDALTNGSGAGGMVHRYASSNHSHAGHESTQEEEALEISQAPPRNVFQCVQGPAVCIFLTFFVTLAFFPAWTSRLRSVHQCQESSGRMSNDLYVPFTFVLFNICDLMGRLLAGMMPTTNATTTNNCSSKLVLAALGRCLFFPLLLMCVGGNEAESNVQIESDLYSVAVQALFAMSNGFLVSLAFSHAPTLLPDVPGAMEKASEFLSFSLALGLLCGSLISFQVAKLAP